MRNGGNRPRRKRSEFVGRPSEVGALLAALRTVEALSLREVEEATDKICDVVERILGPPSQVLRLVLEVAPTLLELLPELLRIRGSGVNHRLQLVARTAERSEGCMVRTHDLSSFRGGRANTYIPISPMPPSSAFFSGFSATSASVVRSREATLAAFWSAARTTLVGSMTPASTRSS